MEEIWKLIEEGLCNRSEGMRLDVEGLPHSDSLASDKAAL